MLKKAMHWLRISRHIHVRQREINNLPELVDLIDRFIDGDVKYDLEWDDFASWKHSNPSIEEIRQRIELLEPLFYLTKVNDRREGIKRLIDERNRVAASIGMDVRSNKETE